MTASPLLDRFVRYGRVGVPGIRAADLRDTAWTLAWYEGPVACAGGSGDLLRRDAAAHVRDRRRECLSLIPPGTAGRSPLSWRGATHERAT